MSYDKTVNARTKYTEFVRIELDDGSQVYFNDNGSTIDLHLDPTGEVIFDSPTSGLSEEIEDTVNNLLTGGTGVSLTYDDQNDDLTIDSHSKYTDEEAQDAINDLLTAGTGISLSYDDANDKLTITGTNKYTDSEARDAVGNNIGAGLTYDSSTEILDADLQIEDSGTSIIGVNGVDFTDNLSVSNNNDGTVTVSGEASSISVEDDGTEKTSTLDLINFAGGYFNLTEPTSNNIDVKISSSSIGTTELDNSISPVWSGIHEFDSGIEVDGDITQGDSGTNTIWNNTGEYVPADALDTSDDFTGSATLDLASNSIDLEELREDISPSWTGVHTFSSNIEMASANIDLKNSNQVINAPSPTETHHLARKSYVDSAAQGLNLKESCDAATDGTNIDLTSTSFGGSIDGVSLSTSSPYDRVLLKDQNTASENGIWIAEPPSDPSQWYRSPDADESSELTSGVFTFVEAGTNNGDTSWIVTTDDPITVGTTAINFSQFASAGEITAGDGLSKSGQELSANVSDFAGFGITTDSSNNLDIDTSFSPTWTSSHEFDSGLTTDGDITQGGSGSSKLWDNSESHVPAESVQVTSDISQTNTGLAISTDAVDTDELNTPFSDLTSLFGTTEIDINGTDLVDNTLTNTKIWDSVEERIPANKIDVSAPVAVDSNTLALNVGEGLLVGGSDQLNVRLDIDDSGSNITGAHGIDFGQDLNVVDDTDNTVTVNFASGNYDNYQHWTVKDDASTTLDIQSGDVLDYTGGTDISVTLDSTNKDLTVAHASFNAGNDQSVSSSTVISDITIASNGHVTSTGTENRSLDDWDKATSEINLNGNDLVDNTLTNPKIWDSIEERIPANKIDVNSPIAVNSNNLDLNIGDGLLVGASDKLNVRLDIDDTSNDGNTTTDVTGAHGINFEQDLNVVDDGDNTVTVNFASGNYDNYQHWTITDSTSTTLNISSNSTIEFNGGADISTSLDDTASILTVNHADTGASTNTSVSGASIISSISTGDNGHVASTTTATRSLDQWNDALSNINLNDNDLVDNTLANPTIWDASEERIPANKIDVSAPVAVDSNTLALNVGEGLLVGGSDQLNVRLDIDDSGSGVGAGVYGINFGDEFDVTDDGDNTVTVDFAGNNYDNYQSWTFEEGDGESTPIDSGERAIISGGLDITTELTTNPSKITVNHENTGTSTNISVSGASVITELSTEGRGHVTSTSTGTKTLDDWNKPTSSVNMNGKRLEFGATSSIDIRFDGSDLVIDDPAGVELIRQPQSGRTNFIQGIDVGTIEAPTDSYTQILNTPVTSGLTSGDKVGHTFAVDNQTVLSIEADADGSGGLSSNTRRVVLGNNLQSTDGELIWDEDSTRIPADRIDVSAPVAVESNTLALNIGEGLLVDDSDQLDVRLDIDDSGSDITGANGINFKQDLNVTNDGDNTVTVGHASFNAGNDQSVSSSTVISDITIASNGHVTSTGTENRSLDDWDKATSEINLNGNDLVDNTITNPKIWDSVEERIPANKIDVNSPIAVNSNNLDLNIGDGLLVGGSDQLNVRLDIDDSGSGVGAGVYGINFEQDLNVVDDDDNTVTVNFASGNYDNYQHWTVRDGTSTTLDIQSGDVLDYTGGTDISVTLDSTNKDLTVAHASFNAGSDQSVSSSTVISDITIASNGHVTSTGTQTRSLDDWANPTSAINLNGNDLVDNTSTDTIWDASEDEIPDSAMGEIKATTLNLGAGVENNGGALRVDEDYSFIWTSSHTFNANIDMGSNEVSFGNSGSIDITYDDTAEEMVFEDSNGVELIRQPEGGPTGFLQNVNFIGGGTIQGGGVNAISLEASGDRLKILDKLRMDQNRITNVQDLTFGSDRGAISGLDMGVTSSPASGTKQSYSFDIDGEPVSTIAAEADGSGGIQNKGLKQYGLVEFYSADGNSIAGRFDPSAKELRIDPGAGVLEISHSSFTVTAGGGSKQYTFNSGGGGSDGFTFRDTANSQDLAVFNEGGPVEIPNVDLDLNKAIRMDRVVIGDGASHSSQGSQVIIGDNASVGQNATVSIGSGAGVNRQRSVAIGTSAEANSGTGGRRVAIGHNAEAKEGNTVSVGHQSFADGPYSIALGDDSSANASGSIALGRSTTANVQNAISVRDGATVRWPDDAGTQTAFDLSVTSSPTAGTEQSYSFDIDGTSIATISAEADGSGGIQNKKAVINEDLELGSSLSLIDGTSSNPALNFVNDPNTGFYRSAGDTIAVASNGISGVEFGRGGSAGNVSIPIDNGGLFLESDNSSRTGIFWRENGTSKWTQTYTNEGLEITNVATSNDVIRYTTNDNVDIVSGDLLLSSSADGDQPLQIDSSNGQTWAFEQLTQGATPDIEFTGPSGDYMVFRENTNKVQFENDLNANGNAILEVGGTTDASSGAIRLDSSASIAWRDGDDSSNARLYLPSNALTYDPPDNKSKVNLGESTLTGVTTLNVSSVSSTQPVGVGKFSLYQNDGSFRSAGSDGDVIVHANDSADNGTKEVAIFDYSAGAINAGVANDGFVVTSGTLKISSVGSSSGTTAVFDGSNNLKKASSSERYKENINIFDNDWSSIFDLQPKEFDFIDTGEHDFGYIAEEVAQVAPELVVFDNDNKPDAIKYDRLTVHLVELLDDERSRRKDLEDRVEQLENEVLN